MVVSSAEVKSDKEKHGKTTVTRLDRFGGFQGVSSVGFDSVGFEPKTSSWSAGMRALESKKTSHKEVRAGSCCTVVHHNPTIPAAKS